MATQPAGGGAATATTAVDLTSIAGVNFLTIEVAHVLSTAWMRHYRQDRRTPVSGLKQRLTVGGVAYIVSWVQRDTVNFDGDGGSIPALGICKCGSLVIQNATTFAKVAELCIPYQELGLADGSEKLTNWQALNAISVYP